MKKSPTRPLPTSIFDSRCMMYHRPPHPGHVRARAGRRRSSDNRSMDVSYDFNTKKQLRLLLSLYRRVERSAGTGGQRHRRSGDRRDSLLSLSRSLSRSRSLSLSLSPSPSPSPSRSLSPAPAPARSLSLSLSLSLARALARSRARSLSLSECGGERPTSCC